MNIPAPTKPAESIPTEGNALAVYLVGFYRYEMVTARRAIEAYEDRQQLIPEDAQE